MTTTPTRFTYISEYDSDGNFIGTTIAETGGYFAGVKPEVLQQYAETHRPQMNGHLTQTFAEAYFNHTLRDRLRALVQVVEAEVVDIALDSDTATNQ